MKITYLVNERQADGSLVLVETTSAHWHRIVAANKTAPANERRYFYADILSDNYNLDCIVMEVSKEQHAAWNSERRSARRNRDAAKAYTVLSLEELVESHSAARIWIYRTPAESIIRLDAMVARVSAYLSER